MKDYYLILGNGYIANYLLNKIPNSIIDPKRINSTHDAINIINKYPGHIVINAAGVTGRPNVDYCEDHKAKTVMGNIALPLMVAEACEKLVVYLINIGSGCIYTGYEKEWTEEDEPNFEGSFYSRCKRMSQELVDKFSNTCTLRIRMPIDENMAARCLITKLLAYIKQGKSIMSGNKNSMTYLEDLSNAIVALSAQIKTGTYNIVNDNPKTMTQILKMYKEIVDPKLTWVEKPYEELGLKALRSNCVLSNEKIKNFGVKMPDIDIRLTEMFEEITKKDVGLS